MMNAEQIKNDILMYIKLSKEVIDGYLDKRDYRQALGRLLMTLDKLDGDDKQEMINYYINNMRRFDILRI
jgi:hypothetical protein